MNQMKTLFVYSSNVCKKKFCLMFICRFSTCFLNPKIDVFKINRKNYKISIFFFNEYFSRAENPSYRSKNTSIIVVPAITTPFM
jgi:hypothetical protein